MLCTCFVGLLHNMVSHPGKGTIIGGRQHEQMALSHVFLFLEGAAIKISRTIAKLLSNLNLVASPSATIPSSPLTN